MRSEFDFIQNIKSKYSLNRIGDDCAVLPKDDSTDMVVTADMLVEEIDFRLDWTTPQFLGHKALAVSLSDIAAMGAKPAWAMLSLGMPETLWNGGFADKFFEGFHDLAATHGVEIVGGDVSRTPDKLVIDSIVGGEVPKGEAVLRSGARVGDLIFVSGALGGAAGGLKLLENGVRYGVANADWEKELLLKQLRPSPQRSAGIDLREFGVTSMIDLSDGLSSDLNHICRASNVGAELFAERIPVNRNLGGLRETAGEQLEMALDGGEDFELLFTVDKENNLPDKFRDFFCIGEMTSTVDSIRLIEGGKTRDLEPKGYRHF